MNWTAFNYRANLDPFFSFPDKIFHPRLSSYKSIN